MVEKPSPTKTAQSAPSPTKSMRGTAWRKVVETLRPAERKKRRAKEFDAMMRREIDNPIGGYEETNWRTVFNDGEVHTYTAITHREVDGSAEDSTMGNWTAVLGRVSAEDVATSSVGSPESEANDDVCETMSLWSALACTAPEDGEDGDEITALPPFRAQERYETPEKKGKKKLKKAKSMPL